MTKQYVNTKHCFIWMHHGHLLHNLLVIRADWIILQIQAEDSQLSVRQLSHLSSAAHGMATGKGGQGTSSQTSDHIQQCTKTGTVFPNRRMAIRKQNRAEHV